MKCLAAGPRLFRALQGRWQFRPDLSAEVAFRTAAATPPAWPFPWLAIGLMRSPSAPIKSVARFRPVAGLRTRVPVAAYPVAAFRSGIQGEPAEPCRILGDRLRRTGSGVLPGDFWCLAAGGNDQRFFWPDRGLDSRSLFVPRQARSSMRWSICLCSADGRCRDHAGHPLRRQWLDWPAPGSHWASRWPFRPLGIVVALTFIGLPFVVRTLQPVIEDIEPEVEEAAASLGASRLQTFSPSPLAGALAGAR
jgi:hypothetical protein